jgi:hypothetical protein
MTLWRIARLGFLIGVVIVLGQVFWRENRDLVLQRIDFYNSLLHGRPLPSPTVTITTENEATTIDTIKILETENAWRLLAGAAPFERNASLDATAQRILEKSAQLNWKITTYDFAAELDQGLKTAKPPIQRISNFILLGPISTQDLLTRLQDNPDDRAQILEKSLTLTGFATGTATVSGQTVSVTVQVFAQPDTIP